MRQTSAVLPYCESLFLLWKTARNDCFWLIPLYHISVISQLFPVDSCINILNLFQYIPVTGAFLGTCHWHAKNTQLSQNRCGSIVLK